MNYQCGNCEHHFSEREALCDDWRVEEKAFICPACKSSLQRPDAFKNNWKTLGAWFLVYVAISSALQYFFQGLSLQLNIIILVLLVLAGTVQAFRSKSKSRYVKAIPYCR